MYNALIGNWHTTATGLFAAIVLYLNQAGANLPTDSNSLKALLASAAIAALGAVSKSAAVGSQAK